MVIRGGTVVTASDSCPVEIGIVGERIAAIGDRLEGVEIIDPTGRLVLPASSAAPLISSSSNPTVR